MKNKSNKNQGTGNINRDKINPGTDRETTLNERTTNESKDGASDAEELSDIHKKEYPDHRIISEDSKMEGGQGGLTQNRKNETTAGFHRDNDDYKKQSDQKMEDDEEYNEDGKDESNDEDTRQYPTDQKQ